MLGAPARHAGRAGVDPSPRIGAARPSGFYGGGLEWCVGRLTGMPPRLAPMPPRVAALPKEAERFYQSAEWRALVRKVKAERGAWCARCGSKHRVIADHVIERRDGGAELDPANIELLCQACHNRKTAAARLKRAMGGR